MNLRSWSLNGSDSGLSSCLDWLDDWSVVHGSGWALVDVDLDVPGVDSGLDVSFGDDFLAGHSNWHGSSDDSVLHGRLEVDVLSEQLLLDDLPSDQRLLHDLSLDQRLRNQLLCHDRLRDHSLGDHGLRHRGDHSGVLNSSENCSASHNSRVDYSSL